MSRRWLASSVLAAMLPGAAALHADPRHAPEASALRPLDVARLPARGADVGATRLAMVSLFTEAELIDRDQAASMVGVLGHLRVNDGLGVGLLMPLAGAWYSDFESITDPAFGSPRLDVALKLHERADRRVKLGLYGAGALNWQQREGVLGRDKQFTGAVESGVTLTIDGDILALHLQVGGHLPFGASHARRTGLTSAALAVAATERLSLHAGLQAAPDLRLRPYWTTALAGSLGARASVHRHTALEIGARYALNPEAELIYNSLGRWVVIIDVVHLL